MAAPHHHHHPEPHHTTPSSMNPTTTNPTQEGRAPSPQPKLAATQILPSCRPPKAPPHPSPPSLHEWEALTAWRTNNKDPARPRQLIARGKRRQQLMRSRKLALPPARQSDAPKKWQRTAQRATRTARGNHRDTGRREAPYPPGHKATPHRRQPMHQKQGRTGL